VLSLALLVAVVALFKFGDFLWGAFTDPDPTKPAVSGLGPMPVPELSLHRRSQERKGSGTEDSSSGGESIASGEQEHPEPAPPTPGVAEGAPPSNGSGPSSKPPSPPQGPPAASPSGGDYDSQ
jgi:hypothetical protein